MHVYVYITCLLLLTSCLHVILARCMSNKLIFLIHHIIVMNSETAACMMSQCTADHNIPSLSHELALPCPHLYFTFLAYTTFSYTTASLDTYIRILLAIYSEATTCMRQLMCTAVSQLRSDQLVPLHHHAHFMYPACLLFSYIHTYIQPVWSVSREWQPLLVADSGFLGQLCFICQLVHHCVNASLLLYIHTYMCPVCYTGSVVL
jgi:hypothetical protein